MAALALFGAGMGLFASPNNNAIMAAAPGQMTGAVGGVINVIRSIGMMTGIAAASALLSSRLAGLSNGAVSTISAEPANLVAASRTVLLMLAGFALAALFASLLGAWRRTAKWKKNND